MEFVFYLGLSRSNIQITTNITFNRGVGFLSRKAKKKKRFTRSYYTSVRELSFIFTNRNHDRLTYMELVRKTRPLLFEKGLQGKNENTV